MNTNSVTECLAKISEVTEKNLAILRVISESFRTKRSHIAVDVDGATYAIPSFLSLESRVETMEHNLENILNAPLTGEAFTYHDGTTQRIELSGYSTTPQHLKLEMTPDENNHRHFDVKDSNVFKDFMNPNPFIMLNISQIPNNIKHVNVRKIVVNDHSTALLDLLQSIKNEDDTVEFKDVAKVLWGFKDGEDYTQYDTIKRLPIRQGMAQGTYIIKSVVDHHIDANFDEFFTVAVDKELVYYVSNGTIQKNIGVGDKLVTYNDKVQLEVTDINALTRQMTLKVMYGAYSDLQDETSGNRDLYTLKYYHAAADDPMRELDKTKYIEVPIEEDKYVMVFVAPINDTTNIQAPWGTGLFLDVDSLVIETENGPVGFRQYYDDNVNNIGDTLVAITSMMEDEDQISRLTTSEFNAARGYKPSISNNTLKVTRINKHLDDSKSIQDIRRHYAEKEEYKSQLETVERDIEEYKQKLSQVSFEDTSNLRASYERHLSELDSKRRELTNNILSVSNEIALDANKADVPIENAKYRIRGYVDVKTLVGIPSWVVPIKIDVQYRYKNKSSFTGNVETFEDKFIFSDWNCMSSQYRRRVASLNGIQYRYAWEDLNDNVNEPSFNQVDIPITQGEVVDIRVRFVYNLGYPFAEMTSDWSPITTVVFPDELREQIGVWDIVTSNNDDIQNSSFESMLETKGLMDHIHGEIQDQTVKYRHSAADIASGFFTEERRVIPLYDKILDMSTNLDELNTEVYGASSSNLEVTLQASNQKIQLRPNIIGRLHVPAYQTAINNDSSFVLKSNMASVLGTNDPVFAMSQLVLTMRNVGSHNMKIHSLFPGNQGDTLYASMASKFDPNNYIMGKYGVHMLLDQSDKEQSSTLQRCNQFMYFRTNLPANSKELYSTANISANEFIQADDPIENNVPAIKLCALQGNIIEQLDGYNGDGLNLWQALNNSVPGSRFATLYPYPGSIGNICIPSDESFIVLGPGESISIPIQFLYWFQDASDENMASILLNNNNITGITKNPKLETLKTTVMELVEANSGGKEATLASVKEQLGKIKSAAIAATNSQVTIGKAKILQAIDLIKEMQGPFDSPTKMRNMSVTRAMSFDIRTSLFSDPITYTFTVDASYEDTTAFKKKVADATAAIAVQKVSPTPIVFNNADGTKTIITERKVRKKSTRINTSR